MNRTTMALALTLSPMFGICMAAAAQTALYAQSDQAPVASVEARNIPRTGEFIEIAFAEGTKAFKHFPEDHNVYTQLASKITARASARTTESFEIAFISLNLRDHQYPKTLPPPKRVTPPIDPIAIAANVGFQYIDADDNHWTGLGHIQVVSFQDNGTISGSFSELTLQHAEKALPDRIVTGGRFRARLR